MSSYPPPTNISQSIFNPQNYTTFDDVLTTRAGNQNYLIKTGTDTNFGIVNFSKQINLANVGFQFMNDLNTGIYLNSVNDLRIKANNADKLTVSNSLTTSSQPILVPGGSVAFPSLQLGSSGAGICYVANAIRIAMGAITICYFVNSTTDNQHGLLINNPNISGYTPSALYCYEQSTFTTTFQFTASTATPNLTNYLTRIGNVCTLTLSLWSGTITNNSGLSGTCNSTTALPARFRPIGTGSYNPIKACLCDVNGAKAYVNILVSHTGTIIIYNNLVSQFANTTTLNLSNSTTISWIVG